MPDTLNQSQPKRIPLKLYLSSDHVTEATGKTVAIKISKNGAAFADPDAGASNAVEIGNGWYYFDLAADDTDTVGPLIIRGTSALCDNSESPYDVIANPLAALSNLDAPITSRLADSDYIAPDNASISDIKAKTDTIPVSPASTSDIPSATQNADELLKRDWEEISGEADRSVLQALRAIRNKNNTVDNPGEYTVYKEDDTTEAWRAAVSNDPSSLPITGIDPN